MDLGRGTSRPTHRIHGAHCWCLVLNFTHILHLCSMLSHHRPCDTAHRIIKYPHCPAHDAIANYALGVTWLSPSPLSPPGFLVS